MNREGMDWGGGRQVRRKVFKGESGEGCVFYKFSLHLVPSCSKFDRVVKRELCSIMTRGYICQHFLFI